MMQSDKSTLITKGGLFTKTAEEFLYEMESSNILMAHEYSFKEYVSQIIQFQDIICKMIAGNNYRENMRIDEAMFILESIAREKNLRSHPAVHNGILTMKKLEKEMAITMSGANGENLVSRTLEYLNKPNAQIFRNIYISDGKEETELDAVVLTDNGIIILEMKKVKSNITLTEDGRMVFSGDECYDKIPLGEKMAIKRRLLKTRLKQILAEKGLNIPLYIDSFIVFCAPKGQYIKINDCYRREKYCFRTGLNKKIENYMGCAYYKKEQLEQLGIIFSEMESNVKRFEIEFSFDEARLSIAEALTVLQDAPIDEPSPMIENISNTKKEQVANSAKYSKSDPVKKPIDLNFNSGKPNSRNLFDIGNIGYIAASIFAGVLASSTAVFLSTLFHKA